MSYRIDYRWALFCLPPERSGTGDTRYILAVENGSNNCWERTRRARSWQVDAIGTESHVLKRAVRIAGSCEGGMLQPRGRRCTPEQYIARIRWLLTERPEPQGVQWRARLRVDASHPAVAFAASHGRPVATKPTSVDARFAVVDFPPEQFALFFEIAEHFEDLPRWALAEAWD
jgi:hypothetical protein